MIVIKIGNNYGEGITVDTTSVFADNTTITVDSTLTSGSNSYAITIPPRELVDSVSLVLYNELTETQTSQSCATVIENGLMTVIFQHAFVDRDSYEAQVNDVSGSLLWRGKLFATNQEDIQEYKMNVPVNNIIEL